MKDLPEPRGRRQKVRVFGLFGFFPEEIEREINKNLELLSDKDIIEVKLETNEGAKVVIVRYYEII